MNFVILVPQKTDALGNKKVRKCSKMCSNQNFCKWNNFSNVGQQSNASSGHDRNAVCLLEWWWSTVEVNIYLELFVALLECPAVISYPTVVYLSPECRKAKIKKEVSLMGEGFMGGVYTPPFTIFFDF